ncbi:MAG: histidine phosphatase family protein, partial [Lachnospiraceae bacterium]|nr:histidine phosphatase family protein [Lachnospiraceae bacterium]
LRGIAEKMISGADDNTESMWNARYITEDERIQEISFGEKEGKRVRDENGKLIDPDIICFFQETEKYLPPKGAESFEMLLARTGDFLEELKRKACSDSEQDANILVSTHGAASRALLANITHCPLRDFWCGGVPKNCAVTIVDLVNGEWKIKEQDIIYYGNENI